MSADMAPVVEYASYVRRTLAAGGNVYVMAPLISNLFFSF
jgi:hypothetical protein